MKEQLKRNSNSRLFKHPAWAPRPITKMIKGEKPKITVFEPRSRVLVGFDVTDSRIPLIQLSTEDDSAVFEIENNKPSFEIKTKTGKLKMDVEGMKIESNGNIKTFKWDEKKEIANTLANLALNDEVYRSIGVNLGRGLRKAASATRVMESSIGSRGSSFGGEITSLGGLIPSPLEETLQICAILNIGESVIEDVISVGNWIGECTQEVIENTIEECIDPIPDCLRQAAHERDECRSRCNRRYRKWHNKWMRPICKAVCWVVFGIDAAICLAKALICTIVVTTETVWHCITKSGVIPPDEPTRSCDIRLFEAEDAIGNVIDFVTCGYGYSHAALICGDKMIHATSAGVESTSLDYYGNRKFATVRLGLTDSQCEQLCACVDGKIGSDFDYLEAITFGTVNDPGREICTMLIMHCLDTVGFDREAINLGGFVSPNDLARQLGAPRASNL